MKGEQLARCDWLTRSSSQQTPRVLYIRTVAVHASFACS